MATTWEDIRASLVDCKCGASEWHISMAWHTEYWFVRCEACGEGFLGEVLTEAINNWNSDNGQAGGQISTDHEGEPA